MSLRRSSTLRDMTKWKQKNITHRFRQGMDDPGEAHSVIQLLLLGNENKALDVKLTTFIFFYIFGKLYYFKHCNLILSPVSPALSPVSAVPSSSSPHHQLY